MQKTRAFALLASVPEIDLMSGLEAIAAQLDADDLPPDHAPKVAFGSMAFEAFAEVEKLRGGKAIEVFIYASNAKGEQPLNPEATWRGLYVGYVGSRRGRYPGNAIFRPKSTASDRPSWQFSGKCKRWSYSKRQCRSAQCAAKVRRLICSLGSSQKSLLWWNTLSAWG